MLMDAGEPARAGGRLARCQRLLGDVAADSTAHMYRMVLEAYRSAAVEGDYSSAESMASRVVRAAREAGEHDVEALGLNLLGRSIVRAGRGAEGLPILDEAIVAVTSFPLSPIVRAAKGSELKNRNVADPPHNCPTDDLIPRGGPGQIGYRRGARIPEKDEVVVQVLRPRLNEGRVHSARAPPG